jgi:hypothetical protein
LDDQLLEANSNCKRANADAADTPVGRPCLH